MSMNLNRLDKLCAATILPWENIFRQDSALAYRAHQVIELLHPETPMFIPPDLWLLNSPDHNQLDYRIWGVMQDQMFQTPDRRQHLIDACCKLQSIVNRATDEWR